MVKKRETKNLNVNFCLILSITKHELTTRCKTEEYNPFINYMSLRIL